MLCVDKQRRVFEMYRARPYRVVVHLRDYLTAVKLLLFHATRYVLAYHVLHAERVESSIGQNGETAKRCQDDAVLPSIYPVHVLVS